MIVLGVFRRRHFNMLMASMHTVMNIIAVTVLSIFSDKYCICYNEKTTGMRYWELQICASYEFDTFRWILFCDLRLESLLLMIVALWFIH